MKFKVKFRCIRILGSGGIKRALIIGVSQIPNVSGWLNAILAVEDGTVIQSTITLQEFNESIRNEVSLLEVEESNAPPVLYNSSGGIIT